MGSRDDACLVTISTVMLVSDLLCVCACVVLCVGFLLTRVCGCLSWRKGGNGGGGGGCFVCLPQQRGIRATHFVSVACWHVRVVCWNGLVSEGGWGAGWDAHLMLTFYHNNI